MLVKFLRESKRNLILYNRANLNRNTNSIIWINDDVSDLTRRQRKTVRDISTYAKSIGQTDLKVHGDGLVVGNGKFKHQDLDLLPPHLSIANAKQPSNESDLYFQSEYSPLSNFYLTRITDDSGTCYNSAEQYFQHKKALSNGYTLIADKIMINRDPYELKRLGNKVQPSKEWNDIEEETMTQILRSKYTQNPDLAEILISTDQLHLHEASADQKWATGAELASKALQSGSWPGLDRLGCLLEAIRAELQGHDSVPSPAPPSLPDPALQPTEGDDLSPMPEDDENSAPVYSTTPHPSTLSPSARSTQTQTLTATQSRSPPPDAKNNTSPLPPASALTSDPETHREVPPLMQQPAFKPPTPTAPHNSRPPPRRKSYHSQVRGYASLPPTSASFAQINNNFGATSYSPRRTRHFVTSDRAPVRRSARLSQSVSLSSSQP